MLAGPDERGLPHADRFAGKSTPAHQLRWGRHGPRQETTINDNFMSRQKSILSGNPVR
jgi:hypothetical protein